MNQFVGNKKLSDFKKCLLPVLLISIIFNQAGYPSAEKEEKKYPVAREYNLREKSFKNELASVQFRENIALGIGMCMVLGGMATVPIDLMTHGGVSQMLGNPINGFLWPLIGLMLGSVPALVYSQCHSNYLKEKHNNCKDFNNQWNNWVVDTIGETGTALIQQKRGREEECPICMNNVGENTIFVEAPNCGHNYCKGCYQSHVLGSDPNANTAKCYYCQGTFNKESPVVVFRPLGPEMSLSRLKPQVDQSTKLQEGSNDLRHHSQSAAEGKPNIGMER